MLFSFLLSLTISSILTLLVIKLAKKLNILDTPNKERKIHKNPTPLLGGLAIYGAFFVVLFLNIQRVTQGELTINHWLGVLMGASFLIIGGFLDDKYNLAPKYQFIFPVLAVAATLIGGVEIEKITNPLEDGFLFFSSLTSIFFISFWLLGMMYTTKLLDGLDGLVTGNITIGALIIAAFTSTTKYYQPDITLVSLILAGSCIGFLIFNFYRAKIFLGEGGSLLLGYLLGVIAIISGAKVAITLMIIGIPIIDTAWTIIRRILNKKNPFKFSDRLHLHHRLHAKFGTKKTVIIYHCLTSIFGISAIFLQSRGKVIGLGVLILVFCLIIYSLNNFTKPSHPK